MPLASRVARAIDLAVGERLDGPIFIDTDGQRLDRHAAGRLVRRIARQARRSASRSRTAARCGTPSSPPPWTQVFPCVMAASHVDPRTTMRYDRGRHSSTGTPPTSSPPSSLAHPATRRPALGVVEHPLSGLRSVRRREGGRAVAGERRLDHAPPLVSSGNRACEVLAGCDPESLPPARKSHHRRPRTDRVFWWGGGPVAAVRPTAPLVHNAHGPQR